jgi:hypothetical protein
MSALNARCLISLLLAIITLVYATSAESILLRGAGRGSNKDSDATQYYLVNNSQINQFGLKDSFTSIENQSLQSGTFEAGSTPYDCYVYDSFADDGGPFVDEPCSYEFYQDEPLQFDGFSSVFFANAADIMATWHITQGQNSWSYEGVINHGNAILDILMPAELSIGDYMVSLDVSFHAGDGFSFFSKNVHDTFPDSCGELIPGDEDSFTCSYSGDISSTLSFSSPAELMRILPGTRAIATISEPGLWMLWMMSVLALLWLKRAS